MAYETGTTTGGADTLSKLSTFAAANGWTIDDAVGSNKFALHKGGVYISFRFDSALTTGLRLAGIHHALGHTATNFPGTHPNDSGSGFNSSTSVTNANIDNGRYISLGRSPDELPNTYHFFENNSGPAYIHAVIARSDGQHRHFGFGELAKFGNWIGGEYCYGQWEGEPSPSSTDWAAATALSYLLDGIYSPSTTGGTTNPGHCSTLHIEGFPGQAGSSKWGEIKAAKVSVTQNDTAGNARTAIQGGYRGGPVVQGLGNIGTNKASGFINTIPINLLAFFAGTSRVHYLGHMPDVRGIILSGIAPGEEIDIGTDTWVCFPSLKKSTTNGATSARLTRYQGICYRKETA